MTDAVKEMADTEARTIAARAVPRRLGKSGWVVVSTLMLATALSNIASVGMFPQIVTLSEEFGRPVNQVVWTMTGFTWWRSPWEGSRPPWVPSWETGAC